MTVDIRNFFSGKYDMEKRLIRTRIVLDSRPEVEEIVFVGSCDCLGPYYCEKCGVSNDKM